MSVTLNGHVYDISQFVGYGYLGTNADTGLVQFPNSIFTDMLATLAASAAILGGGLNPSTLGNVPVSDGTVWRRTTDGAYTAKFNTLLATIDATYDIGAAGANRHRDLFLSRNAVFGGSITAANWSVGGSDATAYVVGSTGTHISFGILANTNAGAVGVNAFLRFKGNSGLTSDGFFGIVQNAATYGDWVWNGNSAGAYIEQMRLSSTGSLTVNANATIGGNLATLSGGQAVKTVAPFDSATYFYSDSLTNNAGGKRWRFGGYTGGGSVSSWDIYNDTDGQLVLTIGALSTMKIGQTLLAITDASYDLGASGANRFRDLFLSRNLTMAGHMSVTTGGDILVTTSSTASSNLLLLNGSSGFAAGGGIFTALQSGGSQLWRYGYDFTQNAFTWRNASDVVVATIAQDGSAGFGASITAGADVTSRSIGYLSAASVSVTAGPTVIVNRTTDLGQLTIVSGNNGGAIFSDLVFWQTLGGATVLASKTVSGAPSARTYTVAGSALKLSMAAGTYAVTTSCLSL